MKESSCGSAPGLQYPRVVGVLYGLRDTWSVKLGLEELVECMVRACAAHTLERKSMPMVAW